MSYRLGLTLVVIIVPLLAGCFQSGDPEKGTEAGDDPIIQPPPPPDEGVTGNTTPPVVLPRNVEFTNCTHQEASFEWPDTVAGPGPGSQPPGWEPRANVSTNYLMYFMDCGRVAWGPFERPLILFLETHNIRTPPDKCNQVGSIVNSRILHRMWLNDEELATYLNESYGIPVLLGDVSFEDTKVGTTLQRVWSFGQTNGGEPSTITWPLPAGTEDAGNLDTRFVWWTGTVLGFLDVPLRFEGNLWVGPAVADFKPPSLVAETGIEHWTGIANWLEGVQASSDIFLWADTGCNEPI